MSDSAESKKLLKKYATARIPFIAINTIEHGRTLDILKETAEELQLSFYVHTSSKGIYDIVTEKITEFYNEYPEFNGVSKTKIIIRGE